MSKPIRSTTVVRRPPGARVAKRPIYVIASGGEVFIARRTKDALAWAPANEDDFGIQPPAAANDPLFNNLESHSTQGAGPPCAAPRTEPNSTKRSHT